MRPVTAAHGLAVALFLVAAGCSAPPEVQLKEPSELPMRAVVTNVPLVLQQDYHCGPAALEMVMRWSGSDAAQNNLGALSLTPGAEGSYSSDMLGTARRTGYLAVPVSDIEDLFAEIAAGYPVVVLQNLALEWAPRWHYGVVTGYDRSAGTVTLHSGRLERTTMDLPVFARTWARGDSWGLVVLPPGTLPETGTELEVLQAAEALERIGRYRAAELSYRAGARRWTNSWIWAFGLGNARYHQGNLAGAEAAYSRALALDPSIPEIRKNLAETRARRRKDVSPASPG